LRSGPVRRLDSGRVQKRRRRASSLLHVAPTIIPATDLAGVGALKRGRVFLLADQSGDVVPDSRGLGLYLGDTRMLSCLVLSVGGASSPSCFAGPRRSRPRHHRAHKPRPWPDPGRKPSRAGTLSSRSIGIVRQRWVDGGLYERLTLANYTDDAEVLDVDLLIDADMADIFEVRGFVRAQRGHFRPIVVREGQADFEYRGLDGRTFRTRVMVPGARVELAPSGAKAALRVRWRPRIEPGARAALEWSILPDILEASASEERAPRRCRSRTSRRLLPRRRLPPASWVERPSKRQMTCETHRRSAQTTRV